MDALLREHIRLERDELRRRKVKPELPRYPGLAYLCWMATDGDPLLALALALDRLAERDTGD